MGIYLKGLDIYPAVISKAGRFFQARFVDIPSCLAMGLSAAEAESKAERALADYHRFATKHSKPMPQPSIVANGNRSHDRYVAYIQAPMLALAA